MAINLADVLSNKTQYPDTLELSIGTEKVSLSDLRTLTKAEQQRLSDAVDAAQKEKQQAETLRQQALTTSTQAADLLAKLEQRAAQPAQPAANAAPDDFEKWYDTDPSYAPVRKRLSAYEQQLKDAIEGQKRLQGDLQTAGAVFIDRVWADDYRQNRDRLKGDKYKDYRGDDGYKKLAAYAKERNLVDSYGLPSVAKAIADITHEDETERIRREAREEGLREGRREGRLGSMPRPNAAASRQAPPESALAADQNFNDLEDKALSDPETRELLATLGDLDPGTFTTQ